MEKLNNTNDLNKRYYNIYSVNNAIMMINLYFEKRDELKSIEHPSDKDIITLKSLFISSFFCYLRCFENGLNNEKISIENILSERNNDITKHENIKILKNTFGKIQEIRHKELVHLRLCDEYIPTKKDKYIQYLINNKEKTPFISKNNISIENNIVKIETIELFLDCESIGLTKNNILGLYDKTKEYLENDFNKWIHSLRKAD